MQLSCTRILSSVQFSHSVMLDSLQPHESQQARPPCPAPTPGVHPNSCPSSQWCHPAISSSVVPFSSCPQSFPASGSFPVSQLLAWGGQSTGVWLEHIKTLRREGLGYGLVISHLLIESSEILEVFLTTEYTSKCPWDKCHAAHCKLN